MDQVSANPKGVDEDLSPHPSGLQIGLTLALLALVVWSLFVIRDRITPGRPEVKLLKGGNPRERRRAAREMGNLGPKAFPSVARALCAALEHDTDAIVRGEAAKSLGLTADNFLKAGNESEMTSEAVDSLVKGLRDIDSNVRERSAQALSAFARSQVHPPVELTRVILSDEEPEVKAAAAGSVARYREVSAHGIRDLLQAIRSDSTESRRLASVVLSQVVATKESVPDLLRAVEDPTAEVRCRAADLLARLGEVSADAVPALIRNLDYQMKPRTEPTHIQFDPVFFSAYALGRIAPRTRWSKQAVEALVRIIDDPEAMRVESAANALVQFGDEAKPTVSVLHEALRRELSVASAGTKAASLATALGELAPKTPSADEVVKTLVLTLDSKSDAARTRAVAALAKFGDLARPALPRLRELLRDRNIPVRYEASRVLGLLTSQGGR